MKKLLLIAVVYLCMVGVVGAEEKYVEDKLYINNEILKSFERCNYVDGDKVWRTTLLSPKQGFFNSIWLTDHEYNDLLKLGHCRTIYRERYIEILNIDNPTSKEKDLKETLDKIYSMVADLHIKQMGVERYEQIAFPDKYLPKVKEK